MAAVTVYSDFGTRLKVKLSDCFHFFPICNEVMEPDAMILVFTMLSFSQLFHSIHSPSSRGFLGPLHFLPLVWYHLHIWGCWYFSLQSWFQYLKNKWCHRSYIMICFSLGYWFASALWVVVDRTSLLWHHTFLTEEIPLKWCYKGTLSKCFIEW